MEFEPLAVSQALNWFTLSLNFRPGLALPLQLRMLKQKVLCTTTTHLRSWANKTYAKKHFLMISRLSWKKCWEKSYFLVKPTFEVPMQCDSSLWTLQASTLLIHLPPGQQIFQHWSPLLEICRRNDLYSSNCLFNNYQKCLKD